jgi:hypothetical protein
MSSLPIPRPQRQAKPQEARQVRLFRHADGHDLTVIEITEGGTTTEYGVAPLASDFGRAFRWTNLEPVPVTDGIGRQQSYDVLLEEDGRSCTCPGFGRWGKCRHADTTLEQVQAGRL